MWRPSIRRACRRFVSGCALVVALIAPSLPTAGRAGWAPGAARAQDQATEQAGEQPADAAPGGDPLLDRAAELAAFIAQPDELPPELFDPGFLAAVPPARVLMIARQVLEGSGTPRAPSLADRSDEFNGQFELELSKGYSIPMTLGVSSLAPHRIVSLWFGPAVPALPTLEAVAEALGKLPGSVSFAVARLRDGAEPELLVSRDPARPLAIGSAFKLWILAALAEEIRDGTRRWNDVTCLRPEWTSLPSGVLQTWPALSPVTLHTLATLMVSQSDNTATDHLLHLLGRERVEAVLAPAGVRDAVRPAADGQGPGVPLDVPLLSTAEMFRIKLAARDEAAQVWLRLGDAEKRRRWLDGEVASLPLSGAGTDSSVFTQPSHIDTIEWFASAADLVRTHDLLRRLANSAVRDDAAASTDGLLDVLAVNPGVPLARQAFDWAGYKGGSEPGVLCLSWLLRARPRPAGGDGGAGDAAGGPTPRPEEWYALAIIWNDPAQAVDEERLLGLASRALRLLARH